MKTLTAEQVNVIIAYMTAIELRTIGTWPGISDEMETNFGIEDPETALEELSEFLNS